jgi:hypothetical protein
MMGKDKKTSVSASADIGAIDVGSVLFERLRLTGKFPTYLQILDRLQESADEVDEKLSAELRAILGDIEAKMEEATLDDLGTLADFGMGALADLNKVCEKIIQRQRISGTFTTSFDILRSGGASAGFQDLHRRVSEYLGEDASPEARQSFLSRLFNSVADLVGGEARREAERKEKQQKNEREQELILQDLRHQAVESIKLETELKNAQYQIKPILASLDSLLQTQKEAYKHLLLYIVAGDEILRRYREVELPEARKNFEAKPGEIAAQAKLADVQHIHNALANQVSELKMEYDSNLFLSQMIIDQRRHYETIDQMISDSLGNTLALWKGLHRMQGLIKSEQDNAVRQENLRNYRADLMTKTNHTLRKIEMNGASEDAAQTLHDLSEKFNQLETMLGRLEETRTRIEEAKEEANMAVMEALNGELKVSIARLDKPAGRPLAIEDKREEEARPQQPQRRLPGPQQ